MAPTLYCSVASPPVRAVLLTAKALGLELDLKEVNLIANEHLTPEYLKMNPQHTIPTLDDNGYILWDSHAIAAYLVEQYGSDDSLYPKDLKKRAIVDQRLHYDSGIVQSRFFAIVVAIYRDGIKTIPQTYLDLVSQSFDMLDIFLEGKQYFAGDQLTIADFCLAASISTAVAFVPIDGAKQPRLAEWMNRMEELPYFKETNRAGAEGLAMYLKSKLAQN